MIVWVCQMTSSCGLVHLDNVCELPESPASLLNFSDSVSTSLQTVVLVSKRCHITVSGIWERMLSLPLIASYSSACIPPFLKQWLIHVLSQHSDFQLRFFQLRFVSWLPSSATVSGVFNARQDTEQLSSVHTDFLHAMLAYVSGYVL